MVSILAASEFNDIVILYACLKTTLRQEVDQKCQQMQEVSNCIYLLAYLWKDYLKTIWSPHFLCRKQDWCFLRTCSELNEASM